MRMPSRHAGALLALAYALGVGCSAIGMSITVAAAASPAMCVEPSQPDDLTAVSPPEGRAPKAVGTAQHDFGNDVAASAAGKLAFLTASANEFAAPRIFE